MTLSREQMREYQRGRRAKIRGVQDSVTCPGCVALRALVWKLEREVLSLTSDKQAGRGVIKTKADAVKVVQTLPAGRVKHSPTCGCMMCRPPKK
jgi:hypothetical protein